jgi:dipeptidyl aminopeptidase/acylaminoacyl peptidase
MARVFELEPVRVQGLAWTPDGAAIGALVSRGSDPLSLQSWPLQRLRHSNSRGRGRSSSGPTDAATLRQNIPLPSGRSSTVAVSPDGRLLARLVRPHPEGEPDGDQTIVDLNRMLARPKPRPRIEVMRPDSPEIVFACELTEDVCRLGGWDGRGRFFYSATRYRQGGEIPYTVVRCIDVVMGQQRQVYRSDGGAMQSMTALPSPDGRLLAITADVDSHFWENFVSLLVVDLSNGSVRRLTTDRFIEPHLCWSKDGDRIFAVARRDGLNQICSVSLGGQIETLTAADHDHGDLCLSPSGDRLGFRRLSPTGRLEIVVAALRSRTEFATAVVLSDPASGFELGRFDQVSWRTTDGLDIRGYLVRPPGLSSGGKCPAIVDVHGGGPGQSLYLSGLFGMRAGTPLDWFAWASLGYVVFVPDMRSSGEYGPQIARVRYAEGEGQERFEIDADVADIEAGIAWLIDQNIVDEGRLYLFGHSAGGPRVERLLARSRRPYAAALIHDAAYFGALPQVLGQISGPNTGNPVPRSTTGIEPFEWLDVVSQEHFLFDAKNIHVPTLIMVGNPALGAVQPLSSEILYSILRQKGVPTNLIRYRNDGHVPGSAATARHRFDLISQWFSSFGSGVRPT